MFISRLLLIFSLICTAQENQGPAGDGSLLRPGSRTLPEEELKFGNRYILFEEDASWSRAENVCNDLLGRAGGHLASIHNQVENAQLALTCSYIWDARTAGMSPEEIENAGIQGCWIGGSFNVSVFGWSDRSETTGMDNWASNEPNMPESSTCTVLHVNWRWFDEPCDRQLPYICMMAAQEDDKDYIIPGESDRTGYWNDAQDSCEARHSNLPSIHSDKQNNDVGFLYGDAETGWIGLNDLETESDFEWVDGTALNYSHFSLTEGQPNEGIDGTNQDCVYQKIDTANGVWFDTDCNTNHIFFCQIDNDIPCACPENEKIPLCSLDLDAGEFKRRCMDIEPASKDMRDNHSFFPGETNPIDGSYYNCDCNRAVEDTPEPVASTPVATQYISLRPTAAPTQSPTIFVSPTESPTDPPTTTPTESPTSTPTKPTTSQPTETPTTQPTDSPTSPPTSPPTAPPTEVPSESPTNLQTDSPTEQATQPTQKPTVPQTELPPLDERIIAILTLILDFSEIEDDELTFENSLLGDISDFLDAPIDRFLLTDLRAGSVLATIEIGPSDTSTDALASELFVALRNGVGKDVLNDFLILKHLSSVDCSDGCEDIPTLAPEIEEEEIEETEETSVPEETQEPHCGLEGDCTSQFKQPCSEETENNRCGGCLPGFLVHGEVCNPDLRPPLISQVVAGVGCLDVIFDIPSTPHEVVNVLFNVSSEDHFVFHNATASPAEIDGLQDGIYLVSAQALYRNFGYSGYSTMVSLSISDAVAEDTTAVVGPGAVDDTFKIAFIVVLVLLILTSVSCMAFYYVRKRKHHTHDGTGYNRPPPSAPAPAIYPRLDAGEKAVPVEGEVGAPEGRSPRPRRVDSVTSIPSATSGEDSDGPDEWRGEGSYHPPLLKKRDVQEMFLQIEDRSARVLDSRQKERDFIAGNGPEQVGDDDSPFKCEQCNKSYVYQRGLKRHVKVAHEDGYGLECIVCLSPFTQKFSLVRHFKTQRHLKTMWGQLLKKDSTLEKDDFYGDNKYNYVKLNDTWRRLFGTDPEEVPEQDERKQKPVSPPQPKRVKKERLPNSQEGHPHQPQQPGYQSYVQTDDQDKRPDGRSKRPRHQGVDPSSPSKKRAVDVECPTCKIRFGNIHLLVNHLIEHQQFSGGPDVQVKEETKYDPRDQAEGYSANLSASFWEPPSTREAEMYDIGTGGEPSASTSGFSESSGDSGPFSPGPQARPQQRKQGTPVSDPQHAYPRYSEKKYLKKRRRRSQRPLLETHLEHPSEHASEPSRSNTMDTQPDSQPSFLQDSEQTPVSEAHFSSTDSAQFPSGEEDKFFIGNDMTGFYNSPQYSSPPYSSEYESSPFSPYDNTSDEDTDRMLSPDRLEDQVDFNSDMGVVPEVPFLYDSDTKGEPATIGDLDSLMMCGLFNEEKNSGEVQPFMKGPAGPGGPGVEQDDIAFFLNDTEIPPAAADATKGEQVGAELGDNSNDLLDGVQFSSQAERQ